MLKFNKEITELEALLSTEETNWWHFDFQFSWWINLDYKKQKLQRKY
jgi:hypothetical protein